MKQHKPTVLDALDPELPQRLANLKPPVAEAQATLSKLQAKREMAGPPWPGRGGHGCGESVGGHRRTGFAKASVGSKLRTAAGFHASSPSRDLLMRLQSSIVYPMGCPCASKNENGRESVR